MVGTMKRMKRIKLAFKDSSSVNFLKEREVYMLRDP